MRSGVLSVVAAGLCLFRQESSAEEVHRPSPEPEKKLSLEAVKSLQEFDVTKNPDYLAKAIATVERQEAKTIEDATALRVALLQKLAPYYDPAYDTNPPPAVKFSVMPPPGYDSGVAPEHVTDPKERAEYEKRIQENRAKSQRHRTQTAIRQLMSRMVRQALNTAHRSEERRVGKE